MCRVDFPPIPLIVHKYIHCCSLPVEGFSRFFLMELFVIARGVGLIRFVMECYSIITQCKIITVLLCHGTNTVLQLKYIKNIVYCSILFYL